MQVSQPGGHINAVRTSERQILKVLVNRAARLLSSRTSPASAVARLPSGRMLLGQASEQFASLARRDAVEQRQLDVRRRYHH
jgi:hypothetical protein